MNSDVDSANVSDLTPQHSVPQKTPQHSVPQKTPRWHLLYFALAFFDVLTVCGSLWLNNSLTEKFEESARVDQIWSNRLLNYNELANLATTVNMPGNEVFETGEIETENQKQQYALREFRQALAAAKQELKSDPDSDKFQELFQQFDAAGQAMDRMVLIQDSVFNSLRRGDPDAAGALMASMDRENVDVSNTIDAIAKSVIQIQSINSDKKIAEAHRIRQLEIVIAVMIVAMVIGVLVYGHTISKQVRQGEQKLRQALQESTENHRRAESALREINALHTALDEHTIYSVADRAGKIISVNEGFLGISGYSRAELLGQNHRIINSGYHEKGFWRNVWRHLIDGKPWRGEVCNRAKDTSLYWVDSTIVPILGEDGKPERYISIRFDVTDRKKAEAKALESAMLIEAQLDAIDRSQGRIEFDSQGNILEVNDLFLEITGFSRTDLIGRSHDSLLPKNNDGSFGCPWNSIELGKTRAVEQQLLTANQSNRWVHATYSPVYDQQGMLKKIVKYVIDISTQKQLESELERARRMESIGQLAAGIAHEINTPLQSVVSNVEYLKSAEERCVPLIEALIRFDADRDDFDQQISEILQLMQECKYTSYAQARPDAIEDIYVAADRVRNIVQAMRTMSHPGGSTRPCELNQIVQDAVTISKNRWKEVADVDYDLAEDLPAIMGDVSDLSQVVINLIVNAADAIAEHRPGGDGQIRIRTTSVGEDCVQLEVIDNGPGIPKPIMERIFEPFFTTKDVGKGTGQGLALSWDIVVNRYKGSISVTSDVDGGAVFRVLLPISSTDSASQVQLTGNTSV